MTATVTATEMGTATEYAALYIIPSLKSLVADILCRCTRRDVTATMTVIVTVTATEMAMAIGCAFHLLNILKSVFEGCVLCFVRFTRRGVTATTTTMTAMATGTVTAIGWVL